MRNVARRDFIKAAGVAAGTFTLAPFAIGKSGVSANSKLNIAMIGVGGIGGMALKDCAAENLIAVCDIDTNQIAKQAKNTEKYPQLAGAKAFTDFRVMLDEMGDQIDGVCINTPDHTHFAATMEVMRRGIHVITQKPLTHDIWQSRTLIKAAEKYGVVTNMANQGHCGNALREIREWYDAGILGQVREVHLGYGGPAYGHYFAKPDENAFNTEDCPANIDWDLWCGPAEKCGYSPNKHTAKWRSFWNYGTGMLGDWFCHTGDAAVWALDLHEPTEIERMQVDETLPGMIPHSAVVRWKFPQRGKSAPCEMYWYDGMKNGGTNIKVPDDWNYGTAPDSGSYWYGDKANAYLNQRSGSPRLTDKEKMHVLKKNRPPQTYARCQSKGPFREWIDAIKGGPKPGSSFDVSARLTETCLLGVLAERFGGKIEWDTKNMRITNRPELNAFVKEPVQNGWEDYGAELWV